ncbi:MAG: hypothetical protein OXH70_17755 [Acidobacteria bacterium]|nr:hypothetical protein [Acidobacteriota bacterium]
MTEKQEKKPRGRSKRVMPELPGPTMREVWQSIFAAAKPPDPSLRKTTRKAR